MKDLSSWSPRRVVWACLLWLVGSPIVGAVGLVLGAAALAAFSGKQPIGVSVSVSNVSLGWLFLPPIILVGLWIWSRRRIHRSDVDDTGSD